MKTYAMAACAMMLCAGSAQAATTIGFTPLITKSSVPVSYTESGFTLTSNRTSEVAGMVLNKTLTLISSIGADASGVPSVSFQAGASFDISGGTFTFDGLSAYFVKPSNISANTFTVTGYLDGKEIYSSAFAMGGGVKEEISVFERFTTGSELVLDRLRFVAGDTKAIIALDNITLTTKAVPTTPTTTQSPVSAVPEPATWAMVLVGFGAIGTAMRRRPVMAVHFV